MQPLIDAGTAKSTSLIAMWTLFNSTAPDPAGTPQQSYNANLVAQRPTFFTAEIVKQALANPSPPPATAYPIPAPSDLSKAYRHIVAGLKSDSEQQIIPLGINARATPSPVAYYTDAGKPKTDLNTNISVAGLNIIASTIKTNLPDWAALRRGGFTANLSGSAADDSYRRTIAANLIGYTQPVAAAPIIGPDYRGVGAYPFVNEFYDYLNWTSSGTNTVTISITSIVELWNMTNQTINGTARYSDYFRHPVEIGDFSYFGDNDDPQHPPNGSTVTGLPYATQSISMLPNEYKVFNFGTAVYTFNTGATPANTIAKLTLNADRKSNYTLEWSSDSGKTFATVDTPFVAQQIGGYGVQKDDNTIYAPGTKGENSYVWSGTLPGLQYFNNPGNYSYNPGDPQQRTTSRPLRPPHVRQHAITAPTQRFGVEMLSRARLTH